VCDQIFLISGAPAGDQFRGCDAYLQHAGFNRIEKYKDFEKNPATPEEFMIRFMLATQIFSMNLQTMIPKCQEKKILLKFHRINV
jgi:hypothetical protein